MVLGITVARISSQTKKHAAIYPLFLEQHDTTSAVCDQRVIPVTRIISQLKSHLRQNLDYAVLCMHHLKIPTISYMRICVLFNRAMNEFIPLINPKIIGNSESTGVYNIHSVYCPRDSIVPTELKKRVTVEWENPAGEKLYSLFDHVVSVMLQIAIDEQNGEIKC